MVDYKYVTALVVILSIDMILIMGQFAMNDINPEGSASFKNYENNSLFTYAYKNSSGVWIVNSSDIESNIPGASASVGTSGDIFSDTFNIFRSYILNGKIFSIMMTVLIGPGSYLMNPELGLPTWFGFLISSFWFIITLFLVVMLITGR